MSQPLPTRHLSTAVTQTFSQLRQLLARYVTIHGLLLVALWLLLIFWVGGLIDYLPVTMGSNETPVWLRGCLLVAMFVGSCFIGYRWIVARLFVRLHDRSLALLIERNYPELNNELITAVELSGHTVEGVSNPRAHQLMLDRVHRSVSERIAIVRPSELFEWQPLWAVGIAVAFGVTLTTIAALGMSEWTGRWSRRLFALSNEPWPRQAALRADGLLLQVPSFSNQLSAEHVLVNFADNVARVPQGAAPQLQISADAGAEQVPEVCTLFYRSTDGARGRANLRRIGSPRDAWQTFTLDGPPLDGLTHDMVIDVVGLDARLRDLRIEVVQPVVVSEMKLECVYPDYLLDSLSVRGAIETIEYRSGLAIPEGTQVTLVGTASAPLSRVEYLINSPAHDASNQGPQVLRSIPSGNSFQLPLGVLHASQVVEVRLVDHFGLSAEQIPRYVVTMREDTVPEVATQLEGIGTAVTSIAQIPIIGTVVDDHGIEQVSAEISVNEAPPNQIPLSLEKTQLKSTIDLEKLQEQQLLELVPGMTLGLVVTAQDYYNLGPKRHLGRGQAVQLSVVTSDQLLVILDRQELELRQRLELIVAELEQLRQVLQTMKTDLPATSAHNRSLYLPIGVVSPQEATRETKSQVAQRLAGMWSQQSVLQADKSQQELSSVAAAGRQSASAVSQ